jgi:penicillin-binding protein 2
MAEFSYGSDEKFFKLIRPRVFALTATVLLLCLGLLIRLWYLEIVEVGNLKALAENNRLRQVLLPNYRGTIYDRTGIELASSRAAYNVVVIREDMPDFQIIMEKLSEILPFNLEEAERTMLSLPEFQPVIIARDVSRDVAARVEEHRYELPGVSLDVAPVRHYKYDQFAAHLIGYLGEISKDQVGQGFYADYRQGDVLGKYGVEKSFEQILKGSKGVNVMEVDAAGRELKIVENVPSGSGKDIYLSLDFRAQSAAEKAMEGKQGAVVALKPSTGEILAMVSKPAFNPNEFANGVESQYWGQLITNTYFPLNNRAIQGVYSPGSTFKIIMAAAGLKEGVIDENTTFNCPGYIALGRKVYHCWKEHGHGKMNLLHAIEQSCDVYFYHVGMKLGVDKIYDMAESFGLNNKTGIGLENEKRGLIPNTTWKLKNRHEPWGAGETLSSSIGQGFNLVTPLQMARVISAVANDGWLPTARLTRIKEGEAVDPESLGSHNIGLSKKYLQMIRDGLFLVVNGEHGTARNAKILGIDVAGKTGTSQVVKLVEHEKKKNLMDIPEKYRDHAWFVAYAPVDDPKIAVAVLVEHGGHGGSTSAPIAKEVIAAYLAEMVQKPAPPAPRVKKAATGTPSAPSDKPKDAGAPHG